MNDEIINIDVFLHCSQEKEVLGIVHEYLSVNFGAIESNFYFFNDENMLEPLYSAETASTINSYIKHSEEEGIIDWVFAKNDLAFIPNIEEATGNAPFYFLLHPFIVKEKNICVFASRIDRNPDTIDDDMRKMLVTALNQASIAILLIRKDDEISEKNNQLKALNLAINDFTENFTFGMIANAILNEITNPLQILKANLQLLESGLGDKARRYDIINNHLEEINDIIKSYSDLSDEFQSATDTELINFVSLIEDALKFISFQLKKEGIILEKDFEFNNIEIVGNKRNLLFAVLSLLLNSKLTMTEGGIINIGLFKQKGNSVHLNISDTGNGYTEEELQQFSQLSFENIGKNRFGMILLFVENIIKQHKGSLNVYSILGKGTTIKIALPIV